MTEANEDLNQLVQERDGYRAAYEQINREIGTLRSERDGYKNAYETIAPRYNYLRSVAAPVIRDEVRAELVGKPSIFLVTLPKSGTVFISHSLSQTLGYDHSSVIVTPTYPKNIVWEAMLADFMVGGMVSASHLQPDAENLAVLKRRGLSKIVLHVRDPRAALSSWAHFRTPHAANTGEVERISEAASPFSLEVRSLISQDVRGRSLAEQMEGYIQSFYLPSVAWLTAWLEVADTDPDFDVLLKTHDELLGQEASYLTHVLAFHGLDAELKIVAKSGGTHFRKGDNTSWRDDLTVDQTSTVNAALPSSLKARFGWVD